MNKGVSRLNQLPQPLTLSRKNNNSNISDMQKPYRLGSENTSAQKSGLLSDMKQQLSIIKDGVEKLLTANDEEPTTIMISSVPEVLNITLKQELAQHKQLEERLRKELQKTKADHLNMMEEARQAANMKLQRARKEYKEQKGNLKNKIHRLQQTVEILNQSLSTKQQQTGSLQKLIEQNQSENETSLKLFEAKYQSSLLQFKKLQTRFSTTQKDDLTSLQHRLYEIQKDNSTLRIENNNLKNKIQFSNAKAQRLTLQNEQIKLRNTELEDRVRIQIKNQQYLKQIQELKVTLSQMELEKSFLSESLTQKSSQYEHIKRQLSQINSSIYQNHQMHAQRLQIVNLQVQINTWKQKNVILANQIQYMRQVLEQKQSYIQALQDQTHFVETSSAIKELQERCQVLIQQKTKIIKEYQQAISVLQNSQRSFIKNNSCLNTSRINSTSRSSNFDQILKQQIKQSDDLRASLRQKTQQCLSMKFLTEELERRIETMRNQFQSEKVKWISQQKSGSKSLEYSYQSTKQELQLMKRKQQTLTKKIQMKSDELKKKDEFIQKYMIGKIGMDKDKPESAYLAQQLQKFMQMRLQQSSLLYQNVPKLQTPKMFKQSNIVKSISLCTSLIKQ